MPVVPVHLLFLSLLPHLCHSLRLDLCEIILLQIVDTIQLIVDGRLDREEINHIKELMLASKLSAEEVGEIDTLLDSPVSYARCEELTRDLFAKLDDRHQRQEVLQEIQALFGADGSVSEDEAEVLRSLEGISESMSSKIVVKIEMIPFNCCLVLSFLGKFAFGSVSPEISSSGFLKVAV